MAHNFHQIPQIHNRIESGFATHYSSQHEVFLHALLLPQTNIPTRFTCPPYTHHCLETALRPSRLPFVMPCSGARPEAPPASSAASSSSSPPDTTAPESTYESKEAVAGDAPGGAVNDKLSSGGPNASK
jgi:hypothetical protein